MQFIDDLRNEIHPVFAPQNFPGFDYNALKPSLRLATNLLTAEPLLTFWHAMFSGEETELRAEQVLHAYPDAPLPKVFHRKGPSLDAANVELTNSNLLRLAERVKFSLTEAAEMRECSGLCYRRSDEAYTGCAGTGSDIALHKDFYIRAIADIPQIAPGCPSCFDRAYVVLFARFLFAILLCHELAHAVSHMIIAVDENRSEDFFEDMPLAEAGYQWEACIFGGPLGSDVHPCVQQGTADFDGYGDFKLWPNWIAKGYRLTFDPSSQANSGSSRMVPALAVHSTAKSDSDSGYEESHEDELRDGECAFCDNKPLSFGFIDVINPYMAPRKDPQSLPVPYRADYIKPLLSPRVPLLPSFILSLFSSHFWNVTVPEKGSDALNVVKPAQFCYMKTETCNSWAEFTYSGELAGELPQWDEWVAQGHVVVRAFARRRSSWDELVTEKVLEGWNESEVDLRRRLDDAVERESRGFW